ncbi:MAG TPA: RnfABCDGE type electron transport complex subunit D [Planctomycetota bacterium]|nr:RnfABCDGE type electron transport complex subunit D [Planctomycetota bacterium]
MPEEHTKTVADATPETAGPTPDRLLVTSSPHLRSPESIPRIMWTVTATLLPALAWAVYVFGPQALLLTAIAVASAVATEAAVQRFRGKPITVADGSAVLSGLLVAFVLPAHAPWYVPMTASIFALGIVKQLFGGLGCNVWNPALMGRAFVLAAWAPLVVSGGNWSAAFGWRHSAPLAAQAGQEAQVDAVTGPTPLNRLKERLREFNAGNRRNVAAPTNANEAREALRQIQAEEGTPLDDLYFGRTGGCLGEVNAALLFLGGIVLVALNYIKWQMPVFYIGTVMLLSWALPIAVQGEGTRYLVWFGGQPLAEIFAGGLFLGAFYMATDMVTSPVTTRGQVIFAVGCGLLTVLIRRYGGYPEGVCYAILLMNTATPIINRYTRQRVFGKRPKK